MTNPFTSETYTNIWAKHYCIGKSIIVFDAIKGIKFTKTKYLPVYINLGENFTNGLSYTLSPNHKDFKNKVALVHDVIDYPDTNYTNTDGVKLIKVKQYKGVRGDLSNFKTSDDIISSSFSSSKAKYNFKRSIKLLEEQHQITYKVYCGSIDRTIYDKEMAAFKNLISTRFDDKSEFNTVLPMWPFYEDLIYPLILEKKASLNVIYDKEQPIAMSINFIDTQTLMVAIRSFDISYYRMNIGNIEIFKLIEWCISNGITTLDFSKGEVDYKKRWCNDVYEFYHHILYDSKSMTSSVIGRSMAYYFKLKQYLRDKNVNNLYVRFLHLKKKVLFQK